ncbi:MAG: hypothetical protein Q7U64_06165 [Desulfocapsaceae bacterium]|nr:hypothetical protein [Desulfocapsaceae bacterium]
MTTISAVYISGFLTLLVALYHLRLYKIKNWKEELRDIDLQTQKILYTINLALTILFFIVGFLTFTYANELNANTGLAFGFNFSLCGFWIWRVIWGKIHLRSTSKNKSSIIEIIKKAVGPILIISYLIPILKAII